MLRRILDFAQSGYLSLIIDSLRSKRFCAVREQRITGSFLPLPYPHRSFFGSRPIFRAGKIPKTPFLGLSLLPNSTETLATQARLLTVLPYDSFSPVADLGEVILGQKRRKAGWASKIEPGPLLSSKSIWIRRCSQYTYEPLGECINQESQES